MKKPLKLSIIAVSSVLLAFLSGTPVLAAPGDVFPDWLKNIFGIPGPGGVCTTQYITSRIRFAFFLVLGGLVLVSVVYVIMAAFKYIQSKGEPSKIEEATKSIKAVFMGIAAMVVGIIGMIIVFVLVGARPTSPALFQTCLNAPNSPGCEACQGNVNDPLCVACEARYDEICTKSDPKTASAADQSIRKYFSGVVVGEQNLDDCISKSTP